MHADNNLNKLPFVSFVIPTYNAEKYLEKCLKSVVMQKYPKDKMEIIVIDGGSVDNTVNIAKRYNVRILDNLKRDAESGKFIGISGSKGEIIALVDSDNEIVQDDWLSKMIVPLIFDKDIIGVESQYLIKDDFSIFNRYFTRIKIVDPLARLFASRPFIENKGDYLVLNYEKNSNPIIGANGFLWRKNIILSINDNSYSKFEEAVFVRIALKNGFTKFAAIPNIGIYHHYSDSFKDFIKKRKKIGTKSMTRKKEYDDYWLKNISQARFLCSIIYCGTIIGPILEALYQFMKTRDICWFIHPIMSFITILIYGKVYIEHNIFYQH